MRLPSLLLMLLACAPLARADATREEIDHLRDYLGHSSSCRFVRDGTEYDGAQAVAHVDEKAAKAGGRIRSAEDWIKYAASRSVLSGKAYLVRCRGASDVESGAWLSDELGRWRKREHVASRTH